MLFPSKEKNVMSYALKNGKKVCIFIFDRDKDTCTVILALDNKSYIEKNYYQNAVFRFIYMLHNNDYFEHLKLLVSIKYDVTKSELVNDYSFIADIKLDKALNEVWLHSDKDNLDVCLKSLLYCYAQAAQIVLYSTTRYVIATYNVRISSVIFYKKNFLIMFYNQDFLFYDFDYKEQNKYLTDDIVGVHNIKLKKLGNLLKNHYIDTILSNDKKSVLLDKLLDDNVIPIWKLNDLGLIKSEFFDLPVITEIRLACDDKPEKCLEEYGYDLDKVSYVYTDDYPIYKYKNVLVRDKNSIELVLVNDKIKQKILENKPLISGDFSNLRSQYAKAILIKKKVRVCLIYVNEDLELQDIVFESSIKTLGE